MLRNLLEILISLSCVNWLMKLGNYNCGRT